MHEIVTLQFGQQANYLGTHFWNTQVGEIEDYKLYPMAKHLLTMLGIVSHLCRSRRVTS